mmetsp:Transcript_5882/g.12842  ORF Transcript_5882/g.12842 Transcript_5882/m.12842 type:complete len:208 (-) Transcript_5882:987-1610(-)
MPDLDPGRGDRVVLHVRHGDEAVDLLDAEPQQRVGHQFLEAHVLYTSYHLGALEVVLRRVAALLPLACIVDHELGHLAQRAPLLPVVNDDSRAAFLGGAHALLDAVKQVGPARADVGAEDVGAVALVVHADGERLVWVGDGSVVAEDERGRAADGRQEDGEVRARHQLGEHAARVLEELAPKHALFKLEALGDARKVPDGLDGALDD